MRKTIIVSAFALASSASTALGFSELLGSDTLAELTRIFLNPTSPIRCDAIRENASGAQQFFYGGGGSTSGEQELRFVTTLASGRVQGQYISPMSRALGNRACDVNGGQNAAGIVVGLDALAIVRATAGLPTLPGGGVDTANPNACIRVRSNPQTLTVQDLNGTAGIQAVSGTALSGTTYTFVDWRDAVRLLFAGFHNNGTVTNATPSFRNCSSDVRWTIAENYQQLFDCGAANPGCTRIQHAFRRADLSGTTDTFLSLLNLPGIVLSPAGNTTPFCNGNDRQDNDPIRRTCLATEEVCAANNTLGLVLPIFLGEDAGFPTVDVYNVDACVSFNFPSLSEFQVQDFVCPDNAPAFFGGCFLPVSANNQYGCLADQFTTSFFGFFFPPVADGRVYNLSTRDRTTGDVLESPAEGLLTASYNRIHSVRTAAGTGGRNCREPDATNQIGCLVQASPCSVGFAGQNAFVLQAGAEGSLLNGVEPTETNVRNALGFGSPSGPNYPFARELFYNTMNAAVTVGGVTSIDLNSIPDPDQRALTACATSLCSLNPVIRAAGFIVAQPEPACCTGATPANPFGTCTTQDDVRIRDFNEASVCGAVPGTVNTTDGSCYAEGQTAPNNTGKATCEASLGLGASYGPTNFASNRQVNAPANCTCRAPSSEIILQR